MNSRGAEIKIQAASLTHMGRRRNNEDAFIADASTGLFAVADGMGGHAAGEVASRLTIEALQRAVVDAPDAEYLRSASHESRQTLLAWLALTVRQANAMVYAAAESSPEQQGMGCTLDVALVRGRGVFLAHVGDSRTYAMRAGVLYVLTEDHTLGQQVVARGLMTAEAMANFPQKNVLSRALGVYPDVEVDVAYYELTPGDVFLLCSDGVHGPVTPERMRDAVSGAVDAIPGALVQAALDAGGRDNMTAVAFAVEPNAITPPAIIGSESTRIALASSSLFSAFTPNELLRVQRIAIALELPAGTLVIHQDQPPDGVYLVLAGALSVWRDGAQIGVMGPGDPTGEMALADGVSVVTVRADTPVTLLKFPKEAVHGLVGSDATIAAKFAFGAMTRLASRLAQLAVILARYRNAAPRS